MGEDLFVVYSPLKRTPIPTYLRYTPEEAFSVPLADIFRTGEIERMRKR